MLRVRVVHSPKPKNRLHCTRADEAVVLEHCALSAMQGTQEATHGPLRPRRLSASHQLLSQRSTHPRTKKKIRVGGGGLPQHSFRSICGAGDKSGITMPLPSCQQSQQRKATRETIPKNPATSSKGRLEGTRASSIRPAFLSFNVDTFP